MEDITALICTLNFCSSAAIVSETVRSNIADFACLCPISLIFSTAISQPWVQFMQSFKSWLFENMNSTLRLRWSEMNSSGYHMLGNAIKNKSQGNEFLHVPWTSHQKWQPALVYLMVPGHKWLVELTGDFILKLTGRFDVPNIVQLIVNTPKLGPDIFFLITVVYNLIYNIKLFLLLFLFTSVSLIYWSQSQKRMLP